MKKILLTFVILLVVPALVARAQIAVTDAGAQALLIQGNANFLQQTATELAKLDTQIQQFQQIQNQGQQVLSLMGNPSQALSFATGSTGLNTASLTGSPLFQSAQSIAGSVNGARSLLNNGGGIFQTIPSTTSSGLPILRDPATYNKFDAFEQELGNFQAILTQAQTQRQQLLGQLQAVMNTPTTTDAEQSEKIARINGLAAQLHANDEVIRDANEQRQAQSEANAQDSAKQNQAQQDELNTEFNSAQPQADQQADSALSSILDQKP